VLEIETIKTKLREKLDHYRGVKTLSLGARQDRLLTLLLFEAFRFGGLWGGITARAALRVSGIDRPSGHDYTDLLRDFDLLAESRFSYTSRGGGFRYHYFDRAIFAQTPTGPGRDTVFLYKFNPIAIGETLRACLYGEYDQAANAGKYISIPAAWGRAPRDTRQLTQHETNFRNWLRTQKSRTLHTTAHRILVTGAKYSEKQLRTLTTRRNRLTNLLDKGKEWGRVEWYKIDTTGRGLKGWKVRLKITERKPEELPAEEPAAQDTGTTPADTGATKQAELIAHVYQYMINRNLTVPDNGPPADWPPEERANLVRSVLAACPQFENKPYRQVDLAIARISKPALVEERERREPGE
jgi:hypothetical protein